MLGSRRVRSGASSILRLGLAAILGAVAACTSVPPQGPGPDVPPTADAPAAPTGGPAAPQAPVVLRHGPARWVAAQWSDLPGWHDDTVIAAWPALLASCARPSPPWQAACESARALRDPHEASVRQWLLDHLRPWRVESADGQPEGLITGYYEPLLSASRVARPGFRVPLHAPPAELASRKPWFTREQIELEPSAREALRGREIAYLASPLDALVLHIQGSGRLAVTEADGRRRVVRAAFAGHNDQPYRSVGRWLVDQGAMTLEQASWPAIKAWARANPAKVRQLVNVNPRYVFFREEPLDDPAVGPLGAQGVPLTPGRSIAVDKTSVPYGMPVWIDTTEPQAWSPTPPPPKPLRRLVVAQDTGSAITGAVRADYFWGWGDGAEERAGRMKQPLRMWVLAPKGLEP
jgi:membrane-bound lytic murein transglycosylase A